MVEMSLERDENYVHRDLLTSEQTFHFRQVAVHSSYHPRNLHQRQDEPAFSSNPATCDSNKLSEFLSFPTIIGIKKNGPEIEKLVNELESNSVMLSSTDKFFHMVR